MDFGSVSYHILFFLWLHFWMSSIHCIQWRFLTMQRLLVIVSEWPKRMVLCLAWEQNGPYWTIRKWLVCVRNLRQTPSLIDMMKSPMIQFDQHLFQLGGSTTLGSGSDQTADEIHPDRSLWGNDLRLEAWYKNWPFFRIHAVWTPKTGSAVILLEHQKRHRDGVFKGRVNTKTYPICASWFILWGDRKIYPLWRSIFSV